MSSDKNSQEEQGLSSLLTNPGLAFSRLKPSSPIRIQDNRPLTPEEEAALAQLRSEGQEPNFDTEAQAMPPWIT